VNEERQNKEKQQHLEFIQNTITRLAVNSFKIKELAVLLTTVIFTVHITSKSVKILLVSIFSTIVFWILDAYYLQQERKFRGLYDDATGLNNLNIVKTYEMSIDKYNSKINKKFGLANVMFSKTIFLFYVFLIMPIAFVFVFCNFLSCFTNFIYFII
jgi:hypothetical protein